MECSEKTVFDEQMGFEIIFIKIAGLQLI